MRQDDRGEPRAGRSREGQESGHAGGERPTASTSCERALADSYAVCPVCGGEGIPWRAKLICGRCRAIIQTCCD